MDRLINLNTWEFILIHLSHGITLGPGKKYCPKSLGGRDNHKMLLYCRRKICPVGMHARICVCSQGHKPSFVNCRNLD